VSDAVLRARRALAAALAATALGCAERGAPPGGAIDDTAPTVVAIEPADGATRVPPGSPIRVVFSESMSRESVERALVVAPDAGRIERTWREHTLLLVPEADAVASDGVRIVTILRGAQDRRGNRLGAPFEAAFTSGDSLPPGEIAGKLSGESRDAVARVLLFRAPGPPLDSLAAAAPLRVTSAGADGAFRFRRLPLDADVPLALFALAQPRVGERIDAARDRVAFGPDTLRLSPERPRVDGIALSLAKPDAPGSVAGRLDAFAEATVVRLRSAADTAQVVDASPDSSGRFVLESVAPGSYRIGMFSAEGGPESPVPDAPAAIVVRPGERVVLPEPEPAAPAGGDSSRGGAAHDSLAAPADTAGGGR
jgi:hypothetical protein